MIGRFVTAAVLLAVAGGAHAADGDAAKGEKLARSACAMCHKLTDGTGAEVGPAFAKLAANQAPFTVEALSEVLNQPQHAPAKSKVGGAADVKAIAAYLNGLD
jgi:mono/diheme cytochrome c family protein